MSPNNAQGDQPTSNTGTFQARISGAVTQSISGTVRSRLGDWGGAGFQGTFPTFPCGDDADFFGGDFGDDDDWGGGDFSDDDFGDGDFDDWDDADYDYDDMDCTSGGDSTETFFFLELMPDGDNAQKEAIMLMYDGEITAGTYRIADPDLDSTITDASDVVFAEYMRMPTDSTLESYFGTSGTLTVTAVTDGKISGSFDFASDTCFCANINELEKIYDDMEDSDFEDGDFDGDDDAEYEQFEQFLEARSLTLTGSFADVPLSNEEDPFGYGDDEDWGDDGDSDDDGD